MRLTIYASVLLAGTVLAGCAETTAQAPLVMATAHQVAETTPPRYEARVGWVGARRGGAAVRGEGYEHVIAMDAAYTVAPLGANLSSGTGAAGSDLDIKSVLARLNAVDTEASGAKTTIQREQLPAPSSKPIKLSAGRSGMVPPASRSIDTHRSAWTKFCSGQRLTADEWTVIHNTTGPPMNTLEEKRHNGCAALRNDFLPAAERSASTKGKG